MTVLAVMADLMFSVKIIDAAKKLNLTVEFVKDRETFARKLQNRPALVIFDLNYQPADPLNLIRNMKSEPATKNIPTFAFVSHVQADLRRAAEEAGCDKVVARSAFAQNLPDLLAGIV